MLAEFCMSAKSAVSKMNIPHDKFCVLPWVSIEASPIGTVRPCCLADDEILDNAGNKFELSTADFADIQNSNYMRKLREQFLAGERPQTCRKCWNEERGGRKSKRMHTLDRLKHSITDTEWTADAKPLMFLDLKLGNICNLKCRICGSWSSSQFATEEINQLPREQQKSSHAYQMLRAGAWPKENEQFWQQIDNVLTDICYIEFTGGEPFLIEQHFELLRYAVEQGYSKNIEIHYNTNGTVFPESAELWSNFKHVEIAFSIDNVGTRFEYERYGADWDLVQENIAKFTAMRSGKISTQLCTTMNIQNVYYLPELCDWVLTQTFDHVYFNMLHDPWHMCISKMTPQAQELVINRLTSHEFSSKHRAEVLRIVQFIRNGQGSDGQEFLRSMQTTDEYRQQSFVDTHKEIAKAMGYE